VTVGEDVRGGSRLVGDSMGEVEDTLAQAERHVREGEDRVGRQRALVERLDRHGPGDQAARARKVLATLEHALDLAREHVWRLRSASDPGP
jgi:hypothetical protein